MRRFTFAAALLIAASVARAQVPDEPALELRPFVGAAFPTGDQGDFFHNAPLIGGQLAVQVKRNFHLVGTFGWMPAETKYSVAHQEVDILQYDVGAEFALVRPLGEWEWKPFVGVGGGGRTYLYQSRVLDDESCFAGYAALGMEFQLGRNAARLEARDNLFCFNSPIQGVESETRNEIGLMIGYAFHFR